ncbi:hypothetical protein XH88_02900 [Bradyrhizobium sp. CCBAU 51627]|nr:hypothetical protein [Bradyrhizobium sp. CCBAU 51627]
MTAMAIDKPRGRAWWKELWIQVLIAMAAGIAGAAFVVLAATLSATGPIPVASVALVLGIHRLMSQGLTPTNLIGNAVATIAIAKWEGALDGEEPVADAAS